MAFRRAANPLTLTGFKSLDRRLKLMATTEANRAVRAGLTAGLRVGLKAIKQEVPSTLKDVKKSLGMSVKTAKSGEQKGKMQAKLGAGVGVKKGTPPSARSTKKGDGIGQQNIHWYVIGTKDRETKGQGKSGWPPAGWGTGRMPPNGIVQKGWQKSRSQVNDTIKQVTHDHINRAWQRGKAVK